MQIGPYQFTVPSIFDEAFVEATVLGCATWLWMHSPTHRDMPLQVLSSLLLPAIKHRQFALATEQEKPVFYMAWAHFDAAAEARYIQHPPYAMPEADWNCGERTWILDWVAPFGHTPVMGQILATRLFPTGVARALYHRGNERGLRIQAYHGMAVLPEEARHWFQANPIPAMPHPPLVNPATKETL